MENVLLYIFVNFNLTIVFRMLQGVSPLKIRLDRIASKIGRAIGRSG